MKKSFHLWVQIPIMTQIQKQSKILTIFVFSILLSKTLSFSRSPQNLSQKNDDPGLIHCWIIVKFEYHVRNPIPNILTVGDFKIISDLRGKPFAL